MKLDMPPLESIENMKASFAEAFTTKVEERLQHEQTGEDEDDGPNIELAETNNSGRSRRTKAVTKDRPHIVWDVVLQMRR